MDLRARINAFLDGEGDMDLDEVVDLLSESATRLEEVETALAQAVELAEYVEQHAKGRMVDAVKHFLSLPYAQDLARRLHPNGQEEGN
jgi:hypothetical protein